MKIKKLIYLLPLFLSGCDLVEDTYDAFAEFFNIYLADVVCWFSKIFAGVVNLIVTFLCSVAYGLISFLPTYEAPTITLGDNTLLRYCAYFFPVSETASLLFYLFSFATGYLFLRVILRWLKIWR